MNDQITIQRTDLQAEMYMPTNWNTTTYVVIKDENGVEHKYRLIDLCDALLKLMKDVPEVD